MSDSLADRLVLLLSGLLQPEQIKQVNRLIAEVYEQTAELDQCLTAHAELNDKVCGLKEKVLKQKTLKKWARVDAEEATKECNKLKAEIAEYKYTPQAYDTMWKRVQELE